jgi:RNA polymerase sigma-70 factor, ECF subfamily
MGLPPTDFESVASACSATSAGPTILRVDERLVPAAGSDAESTAPGGPDAAAVRRTVDSARDRALVEQCLRGDLEAFNELVAAYQDYLFALVMRVLGDRDAAADAVQEAFFSAYRNLSRFQGDVFRSWLTRIALNAATDILRQRKRKPADPFPEWEDEGWQPPSGEEHDPELQAGRRARSRVLSTALLQLTVEQRTAIVLFDVQGFDYQEIADMAGVSLGTIKSRIHRGRLALRELLGDQMELFRE